jgi:hypothetical protein
MEYSADLLDPVSEVSPRRRRHPRLTLRSLAYVRLDDGNGGIIRDLTESGIAIQAVARLRPGQEVILRFELLSPRVRVESRGRVAWANADGQAGIQFLGLSPRIGQALKHWQLTQMFQAATASGRDSMFSAEPFVRDLAFSPQPRPAIAVEPCIRLQSEAESPYLRWRFMKVSAKWLSIAVDSLLLLCAALVFAISSVLVMGGLPAWPIAAILFLTSSTIFVAVYQILFSEILCVVTPGQRLAQIAVGRQESQETQRFR